MSKIIRSHVALLLANMIYAINYLFAKDVMPDYITPTGFILLRVMGAFFVFGFIYVCFIRERVLKRDY